MEKQTENLDKITRIISRHPIAFVGAVFFCMFWITYFINIKKNDEAEEVWKELYLKEKEDKDRFRNQLLIKNGIIEGIQKTDTLLKQETKEKAELILKE